MSTIRVFLKWCGAIKAVPADLYEKVMVPRVWPAQERKSRRRREALESSLEESVRY